MVWTLEYLFQPRALYACLPDTSLNPKIAMLGQHRTHTHPIRIYYYKTNRIHQLVIFVDEPLIEQYWKKRGRHRYQCEK